MPGEHLETDVFRVLSHFSLVQLCHPMDCSLPGFSVHGILQARILEWVAMYTSRGSSQQESNPYLLCLLHRQEGSLPLAPPGKPFTSVCTLIKGCYRATPLN